MADDRALSERDRQALMTRGVQSRFDEAVGGGQYQRQSRGAASDGMQDNSNESLKTTDPFAAIAERIAKIRGAMEFNRGSLMGGNSMRVNNDLQAQLGPLEAMLAHFTRKQELEEQALEAQLQAAHRQSRPQGGGASLGNSAPQQQLQYEMQDPYASVRNNTVKAANRYLNIRNPHLFKSLGK